MPGLADEVGSGGHRLPPYNDLWGTHHERREPCSPKNFTLTAPQVHHCAAVVLQDHLKLGDHGPKCRASLLFTLLLYAAARITSLSDACKTLRDAPSDEAVDLALIATLPDFAELQRRLNAALAGNLPRTLCPQPAAHGRRSGPDPLSWPAAARPRRDLPLRGQKRDQPLPRLRHALRHPQRLPLHRGIDPGLPGRTPGGGLQFAFCIRPPKSGFAAACCFWTAASTVWG